MRTSRLDYLVSILFGLTQAFFLFLGLYNVLDWPKLFYALYCIKVSSLLCMRGRFDGWIKIWMLQTLFPFLPPFLSSLLSFSFPFLFLVSTSPYVTAFVFIKSYINFFLSIKTYSNYSLFILLFFFHSWWMQEGRWLST